MNTNYRLYYTGDRKFYKFVLENEEPGPGGFEFKINLIRTQNSSGEFDSAELEKEVFKTLSAEYDATDIRIKLVGEGKLRCIFRVKDKEPSLKLFNDIATNPYMFMKDVKAVIFPQMPEETFVKYGDIMAQKYYEQLELEKK